jgi:hypothetical protein
VISIRFLTTGRPSELSPIEHNAAQAPEESEKHGGEDERSDDHAFPAGSWSVWLYSGHQ